MKKLKFFVIALCSLSVALLTTSCGEDEQGDGGGGVLDPGPILLDCGDFYGTESRTLENDPDRAVDYVIPCQVNVNVDIIIESGTVIEFETDAGLKIFDGGSLSAIGTAADMIVFTGVDKSRGSWAGLYFESADNKNHLSYCHINYGGGSAFNSNADLGNIVAYSGCKISVDNCTIENSPSYGINANYAASYFNNLENNLFKNNDTPILVTAAGAYHVDKSNTFQDNTNSYIEVGCDGVFDGQLPGNTQTWQDLDVPYRIVATSSRLVVITNGNYLILEPGIELVFSANTGIYVRDGAAIKAAGEEGGKQILMTGAEPIPGFWGGIDFHYTNDPRNEVSNATLEYAAGPDWEGAIYMWASPSVTVHDVTFRGLQNCAFYDAPSSCFCNDNLNESNNSFEDAGSAYCFGG
jgi:hypothetical protein